ncbi:MFS general substrate transporter [Meredithblackwellia eburnea MCA 4105]
MLFKLDSTLLTFGAIGMFTKFLCTNNIANAYVSGMQEGLNMKGNEYNYVVTAWNIGYIIGELPATLLLTRFRPHIFIPIQEVLWSVFTFSLAGAKSWQALAGLRFLVGLSEAGYWPSLYWLLGSWYNKRELGKRSALLQLAVQVAPMFSGYLQIAATNGLNGAGGLGGWRWLFIINGIISLPLSIMAFFFLPDDPARTGTRIFTQHELEMAKERNVRAGRASAQPWTRKKVIKILTAWPTILFCLYSCMSIIPFQVQTSLIFWLKKQPKIYSQTQVNALPTLTNGVVAIFLLFFGWVSDGPLRGRRWPVILFVHSAVIALDVALLYIPLYGKQNVRLPLYIFSAVGSSITPLVFAWMADICAGDSEQRAFIVSGSNTLKYITTVWFPNVFFQQKNQPNVPNGIKSSAIVGGFCITNILVILYLSTRKKPEQKEENSDSASQNTDEVAKTDSRSQ